MKKTIYMFSVLGLTLFASCTENSDKGSPESEKIEKTVKSKSVRNPLMDQLYIISEGTNYDTYINMVMENNFDEKITSSNYTWEFFDSFFETNKNNLNSSEKQYLSYIIIKHKDLLTSIEEDPSNTKIQVLKKHLTNLLSLKNKGYALYYECLLVLKNHDETFATQFAEDVVAFANNDEFYKDIDAIISDAQTSGDTEYLQKMLSSKENYSYHIKIENEFL